MGNAPEMIRQNNLKRNSNLLLSIKLPRLRDYFASFKSICDNFSIDLTEFQHIFGTGQSAFVIWDTDNNGLIDSLQLFSGIAMFSDTKIEDKIRFLFDMFDFNEVDYLEPIELEFMIYCVCNASFKIFSITNQISSDDIEDFVDNLFSDSLDKITQITVADLIKKSKDNKEVKDFIDAISFESNINQNKEKEKQQIVQKK